MTPRAPRLTAEQADWSATMLKLHKRSGPGMGCYEALQALADGRTACVRVMSEDECRAEFEAWYFLHAWKLPTPAEIWLASRRALGLIGEGS